MFSEVIADAMEYTRPVIVLYRFNGGKVESNIGTFIHIDDLGHILSASHIFKIGSEDPISAISVIFDGQYYNAEYIVDDVFNDVVILKIKDYKPGSIKRFPKFMDESFGEIPQGTPLVRLGYPKGQPYSHIAAGWDEVKNSFFLDKNVHTTCFHNEGIATQYVDRENKVRLLELSAPALMGQSGGPILTKNGVVVGLQSRNTVLELSEGPPLETGLAATHISIAQVIKKIRDN